MRGVSIRRERRLGFLLMLGVALNGTAEVRDTNRNELTKEDAVKLAAHEANNDTHAVFATLARPGEIAEVAAFLERVGGIIDYRLDEIDYLTAILPRHAVGQYVTHPAVQVAAVDNSIEACVRRAGSLQMTAALRLPSSDSSVMDQVPDWLPALQAHPIEKAYPIRRDIDGEAFRLRDQRFDGRGVVIAHVEAFPDFLAPELQVAVDAEGNPIPKFSDVINVPSPTVWPNICAGGSLWTTRLSAPVVSLGNRIVYQGDEYIVPESGSYRMARFEVPNASASGWAANVYPILQRAYSPKTRTKSEGETDNDAPSLVFDVLWSDQWHMLWIDINGNKNFADEEGVKEYRVGQKFGVLGWDDPATEHRESIGYAVQIAGDRISINLGTEDHASMVAGAAAASRGSAGRIEGIAPGAQLIAIAAGAELSIAAYARGLAVAYTDPRTDVVLIEGRGSVTEPERLKQGKSLLAVLLTRLVNRYELPTVITAGNQPSMSSVWDFTLPQNVISVGASQSAASLYSYYGLKIRYPHDLHWVGGEGPAGDGALKPDLVAPANPLTLSVRIRPGPGQRYPGVFELPSGYMIGAGTSTATPVAAGAVALLVGAAKVQRLPRNARAIHDALRSSARFLSHIPAYKQGRGLLQIDAAWRRLLACSSAPDNHLVEVTAPVRTSWSHTLPTPHSGSGLFEREGWRVGNGGARIITLIRRSGPKTPVKYKVEWLGNTGVFSSANSIWLPLHEPRQLEVHIAPDRPGVHSAIAHLRVASSGYSAAHISATVVAPYELDAENEYRWKGEVTLDRPGRQNQFFRVPDGMNALTVSVRTDRPITFWLMSPDRPDDIRGVVIESGHAGEITVPSPTSGVWEAVLVDNEDGAEFDWAVARGSYLPSTRVQIEASVFSVSSEASDGRVTLTNTGAAFEGTIANTPLGGIRKQRSRVRSGEMQSYDLEVEEGQEFLGVEMEAISVARGDADLFLFDCTQRVCRAVGSSDREGANEELIIHRPTPGKWKAVIVALRDGSDEMDLMLADYYAHPKLGALMTDAATKRRRTGEQWSSRLHLWTAARPKAGYEPIGIIGISTMPKQVTSDGATRLIEHVPRIGWKHFPVSAPTP